jgi:four helix bundle protein
MGNIKSYKDLIAWQKAMILAKTIYTITARYPKEEIYGLTSQLRRAAVSVACNIAEGQARNSTGEFKQFLGISKGSLAETETLLLLSSDLNLISTTELEEITKITDEVGKLLSGLLKSLNTTTNH